MLRHYERWLWSKKHSDVFQPSFFNKTDEKFKNQCTVCHKVLLCKGNNTTSMIRHLRGRHPVSFTNFIRQSDNQIAQYHRYEAKPRKNPMKKVDRRQFLQVMGIRKGSEYETDVTKLTLGQIAIAAVLCFALFIASLLGLVYFVTHRSG